MITGAETAALAGRGLTPIFLEGRMPMLAARDVQALGLHDGQVIQAVVEVRRERLLAVWQGKTVPLPLAWRPLLGQTLTLHVQLLPGGTAALRLAGVRAPMVEGARSAALGGDIGSVSSASPDLGRLARWTAASPGGLTALLGLLAQVKAGSAGSGVPAPRTDWGVVLSAFMGRQPRMATLDATGLKRALMRSGVFSEASLAKGQGNVAAQDLKSTLRALVSPDVSARLEEGDARRLNHALDDLQGAQLAALEGGHGKDPCPWVPLLWADAMPWRWRCRREPDAGADSPQDGAWVVDVHSESAEWGALWLQSRIARRHHVHLTMWAERAGLCSAAVQRQPTLADDLSALGLTLDGMRVIHGRRPADAADHAKATDAGQWFDIQA